VRKSGASESWCCRKRRKVRQTFGGHLARVIASAVAALTCGCDLQNFKSNLSFQKEAKAAEVYPSQFE